MKLLSETVSDTAISRIIRERSAILITRIDETSQIEILNKLIDTRDPIYLEAACYTIETWRNEIKSKNIDLVNKVIKIVDESPEKFIKNPKILQAARLKERILLFAPVCAGAPAFEKMRTGKAGATLDVIN